MKFHKDCDKLLGALIYEEISNYEKETKKTTLFGNSNEVTTFETEAMEMAHHNTVPAERSSATLLNFTETAKEEEDHNDQDRLEVANVLFNLHEV